jgi:hypothetical protein
VGALDEVRFDLRLGPEGSLTVHCTSQVVPEEWADTLTPDSLEQVRLLRDRLIRHQITEAELVRLGLLLGNALVPSSIQQPLARQVANSTDRVLRLRVVPHGGDLAALPWEYLRLPSQYDDLGGAPLALDGRVSLVRSPAQGSPVGVPTHRGSGELRVVHASATRVERFATLRGDDHAVDLALWGDSARRTRRVVIDRLSDPASRTALEEALASGPDLLVFTGHSTTEDGRSALVLADEAGSPDLVSGGELASMLLRAGTPLVVLNACETAMSGEATVSLAEQLVRSGVETVIGMQMPISDSNAGHFAVGMISALGEGHSIDTAVALGRRRVADRAGYAEWGIPTVVTSSRGTEPLPSSEEPRMRSAPVVASGVTRGSAPVENGNGPVWRKSSTTGQTDGGRPPRRTMALVALALIALIGAGVWFVRSDDTQAADRTAAQGAVEPEASTTAPGTPTTPTSSPSTQGGDAAAPDGIIGGRPSTGSLEDTSPRLWEKVDEFERTSQLSAIDTQHRFLELDAKAMQWPGTPATGGFNSTNDLHSPNCWKVQLSSVTVQGVAGRVWTDKKLAVVLSVQQTSDKATAQQYFWANSMFTGIRNDQCTGWPEDGITVDPRSLTLSRMDFALDAGAPADELITAIASDLRWNTVEVSSAYQAVFRSGRTVVTIFVGSLEGQVDPETAKATISEAMRVFASG